MTHRSLLHPPKRPVRRLTFVAAALWLVLRAGSPVSGAVTVESRWLDVNVPAEPQPTTWGVPWPRGRVAAGSSFTVLDANDRPVPVQSWQLATWPDGSVKWSAHALAPAAATSPTYRVQPGTPATPREAITVRQTGDHVTVDTGAIRCRIPRTGPHLVDRLTRGDRTVFSNAHLVLLSQDRAQAPETGTLRVDRYVSRIEQVRVEQSGPIRAVVRIEGRHRGDSGRSWMPFTVRLVFAAGDETVRIVHTIVFDGDEQRDFIRGLGLRCTVPLAGPLRDRHIRFVSDEGGVFAEAVRGITGLRNGPGRSLRQAQVAGEATGPYDRRQPSGRRDLDLVPAFGDFTLFQPNDSAFTVRKRTAAGHAWLDSATGRRALGVGSLSSPQGGVLFGMRHFWQSCPSQVDIRGAVTDQAELTCWLWAPQAGAMDLRFYHDGLGQDTYPEQLEGLLITYEDYEPGFGTPLGVARTSEMVLRALDDTPSRERLVRLAGTVETPARLVCSPESLRRSGVFGGLVAPVRRERPAQQQLEDLLDFYVDFYRRQVLQRHWTGFWNYGDVMHSYDLDRHVWRYDVGGYAWDNSELSTDLWLWFMFLHTGRADVFRLAEAMTRHTGEVDVHHLGPFAPLGSRHNVMHWGCSAKQLRISTAANRRIYYYLTADERTGDLMREQVEAVRTLARVLATRKLPPGQRVEVDPNGGCVGVSFGTDWGAIAAAWLTEWERTGSTDIRDRLFNSMATIAAQPYGFFSESGCMDPDTGRFQVPAEGRPSVSHLSAVFGLFEICAELLDLVDMPAFRQAWLQYCRLYNADPQTQAAELGQPLNNRSLRVGHARLTAYAAAQTGDPDLAARAWAEFYGVRGRARLWPVRTVVVQPPDVLHAVEEVPGLSTNAVAQWGLSALQCLALIGDAQPGP